MILLLLACAHHPVEVPCISGPDSPALAALRRNEILGAGPVAVAFNIRIQKPDGEVNARGALLVAPPDRFRLEISGPIGPPQIVVASDGAALGAYVAGKKRFYVQPAVDLAVGRLTNGTMDADGVVAMLLGVLPAVGAGVQQVPTESGRLADQAAGGPVASFGLDCEGRLASVGAGDSQTGAAFVAYWQGGLRYPSQVDATIHRIGLHVHVDFADWRPVHPTDAVFTLAAPPGFEVLPFESLAPPG